MGDGVCIGAKGVGAPVRVMHRTSCLFCPVTAYVPRGHATHVRNQLYLLDCRACLPFGHLAHLECGVSRSCPRGQAPPKPGRVTAMCRNGFGTGVGTGVGAGVGDGDCTNGDETGLLPIIIGDVARRPSEDNACRAL